MCSRATRNRRPHRRVEVNGLQRALADLVQTNKEHMTCGNAAEGAGWLGHNRKASRSPVDSVLSLHDGRSES